MTKIRQTKKIKRLVKKAEFVDGLDLGRTYSGMLSVYKNPTDKEIKEAKDDGFDYSIRGTILEDGTIYCWSGSVLHNEVPKQYAPDSSFRFAYDWCGWVFDLHKKFTFEQGMNKFLELKQILSRFGELEGHCLGFYFASDDGYLYKKFNNENSQIDTLQSDCVLFSSLQTAEHFINYMNSQK